MWRKGLARLNATLRIIECRTDAATITARTANRYQTNSVHARAHVYPDPRNEWIGLAMPKLLVDTTEGYEPRLDEVLGYTSAA